jgi:hypothetical protein
MARKLSVRECKEWLESEGLALRNSLGLQHWTITYEQSELPHSVYADCLANPEYRNAHIRYDLGKIVDMKDFADHMLHELLHVVHSPTKLYSDCVCESVKTDSPVDKVLRESERQMAEHLVVNLTRMYHGLRERFSSG